MAPRRHRASDLPPLELAGRTLLGRYRIDDVIGRGGMGAVWRGQHTFTGRAVAIKVLDRKFLTSASVVGRFDREARAASAIRHEGIVEILDVDVTEEGVPFLVMEYLNGETLSAHIERRTMSQRDMLGIALPLLDALSAAHAIGVVHRDLKPDNLILVPHRKGFRLKLLDFGISSKEDEIDANLTTPGAILGTPHYMSPEQALGEPLDWRVDIYGAGAVLYECLTGRVPFEGDTYHTLLRQITHDSPTPPSECGAEVDDDVEAVILHALQKLPRNRPQSAREMRDELIAAARGELPTRIYSSNPPMVRRSGVGTVERDVLVTALEGSPSAELALDSNHGETAHPRNIFELAETMASGEYHLPASAEHPIVEPFDLPSAKHAIPPSAPSAGDTSNDGDDGLPVPRGEAKTRAPVSTTASRPRTSQLVGGVAAAAALLLIVGVAIHGSLGVERRNDGAAARDSIWVVVSIEGLPVDSSILLDGLPSATPLRLRAGMPYTVTIRAPGYDERSVRIIAESDLTLPLEMLPRSEDASEIELESRPAR